MLWLLRMRSGFLPLPEIAILALGWDDLQLGYWWFEVLSSSGGSRSYCQLISLLRISVVIAGTLFASPWFRDLFFLLLRLGGKHGHILWSRHLRSTLSLSYLLCCRTCRSAHCRINYSLYITQFCYYFVLFACVWVRWFISICQLLVGFTQ